MFPRGWQSPMLGMVECCYTKAHMLIIEGEKHKRSHDDRGISELRVTK